MGPPLGLRKLSDTGDLAVNSDEGAETKTSITVSNHIEPGDAETKQEAAAEPAKEKPSLKCLKGEDSLLNKKIESDDMPGDLGSVLKGSPFEPQEGFGSNMVPDSIASNQLLKPEDRKKEDILSSYNAEAPSKPSASKDQQYTARKTKPTLNSVNSRPSTTSRHSLKPDQHRTADAKDPGSKGDLLETSKSVGKTSHIQKPSPTSPSVPKKPTSKPPTRPVKLPAAATAPTAASAAKLGGNAPSRSPSRASTNGTSNDRKLPPAVKRDRLSIQTRGPPSATTPGLQKKTPRPVTHTQRPPTATTPALQKKASRTSLPPDEGFLARMMRPTASSASKVHEKIETKSPPRKVPSGKLKRRSDGSEGKSKLMEGETLQPVNEIPQTQLESVVNGSGDAVLAPAT